MVFGIDDALLIGGLASGGLSGLFGGDKSTQTVTSGTQEPTAFAPLKNALIQYYFSRIPGAKDSLKSQITSLESSLANWDRTKDPFMSQRWLAQTKLAQLKKQYAEMPDYTGSASLPPEYETQGIGNINETFDIGSQNLSNELTSRGLSTSPLAGGAWSNLEGRRLGTIGKFRANIPLVAQDLQRQDLEQAMQLFGMRAPGSTSTSTAQTGTTASNIFGNMAETLGYLYGKGLFGTQSSVKSI